MSQSGCVRWVLNVCRVCCRWALQVTLPLNSSLVMIENSLSSWWTWAVKKWLGRSQMSANFGNLNTIWCLLYSLYLYGSWARVLPGLPRESKGVLSAGQIVAELTWMYLSFRVRTAELFLISNSFQASCFPHLWWRKAAQSEFGWCRSLLPRTDVLEEQQWPVLTPFPDGRSTGEMVQTGILLFSILGEIPLLLLLHFASDQSKLPGDWFRNLWNILLQSYLKWHNWS